MGVCPIDTHYIPRFYIYIVDVFILYIYITVQLEDCPNKILLCTMTIKIIPFDYILLLKAQPL